MLSLFQKMEIKTAIKLLAIYILRFVTTIAALLLPLEPRSALFIAYLGKQYSCNPKAIFECLCAKLDKPLNYYWAFEQPDHYRFLEEKGVCLVRYRSLRYYRLLMTTAVIITNCDLPSWVSHKMRQRIIHTWHGGGAYKKVSLDYNSPKQKAIDVMSIAHVTDYISSSAMFTQKVIRGAFGYQGRVIECGMPRNDVFFDASAHPPVIQKIREYFGLASSQRMALFAPTFRAYDFAPVLDEKKLSECLGVRFGGDWVVLTRGHLPHKKGEQPTGITRLADAYDDMQELLVAADVLITDYSSTMWDFALSGKPGFLYVPDIDKYIADRGFYLAPEHWPFSLAKNQPQLWDNILNFNEAPSVQKAQEHLTRLGSFEKGCASEYIVNVIIKNISTVPREE